MSCTDCKGGTPAPLWKRCENCAMSRLRTLMGGAPAPSVVHRRFQIGNRVMVGGMPGKVARCPRGTDYVVDLDGGERKYVSIDELSEEPTAGPLPFSPPA